MTALVWDARLPRDQKFILLCYADHADPYGENIYPSKTTIERMTGYSLRSVKAITAELVREGLLIERGESRLGTTCYAMNVEALSAGGAKIAPVQFLHGEGCKKQHVPGANSAPNPSYKPPVNPPEGGGGDLFGGEPKLEHPEIPHALRTPELLGAWAEWKRHRREKRSPLTPTAMKKQVGELAAWTAIGGIGLAVAALENSTKQNYSGLFLPKGSVGVTKRMGPITPENALRMPKKA